jgi:hypothetical protein
MNLDATETEENVRRVDMNSNNISWGYHGGIMGISWGYHGDIMGISWGYHGISMRYHGSMQIIPNLTNQI